MSKQFVFGTVMCSEQCNVIMFRKSNGNLIKVYLGRTSRTSYLRGKIRKFVVLDELHI